MPKDTMDVDLFIYHVKTVLEQAAKTSDDHDFVNKFLDELLGKVF